MPGPAQAAGLQAGDVVVAVDGQPVEDSLDVPARRARRPGEPLALTVERDGERRDADGHAGGRSSGRPLSRPTRTDRERLETVGAIGVGIESAPAPSGSARSRRVGHSVDTMGQIVTGIWTTFSEKLGTITEVYGARARPRGLHRHLRRRPDQRRGRSPATRRSAYKVLGFLGLIAGLNFFVGVFNLLPLLPLDGGHIAVAALRAGAGQAQAAARLRRGAACGSTSPSCCP